jgi:hypothetical protein
MQSLSSKMMTHYLGEESSLIRLNAMNVKYALLFAVDKLWKVIFKTRTHEKINISDIFSKLLSGLRNRSDKGLC